MKMAIYSTYDGFACTTLLNYHSYIMDARKVTHFKKCNGFNTYMDVVEYMCTYGGCTDADEFYFH